MRGEVGYLILEDGTILKGKPFGARTVRYGEVVFTTAMVGYPESLTDPSYKGQILVETNPLMGNYGVPSKELKENGLPLHYESDSIKVEGFVVSRLMRPNHWSSVMSLDEWLRREGVPGLQGIDTRAVVKKIREKGVMRGAIVTDGSDPKEVLENVEKIDYETTNFVELVSPSSPIIHVPEGKISGTIVVVDMGIKYGILRELLRRGFKLIRIPWDWDPIEAYESYNADGVFFSNGPGNPSLLKVVAKNAKKVLDAGIPTMGVCLGEQVLALADGAEIYKLKYGHRGINKPVKDLESGKAFVTTQNHGYAIEPETLNEFYVWMINLDDNTVEAIKHKELPVIATQYHPEASPGPWDSTWVFDEFAKLVRGDANV
ncbi:carbamoyl-phosphate synthase small subunit [Thermococcus chitonophagus]|uniref:Carbamoyl phosphate synthase small chain n=1 Tax=Thermococcus chitonophagus TaxID=54262 RepID=A0A170SUK5_9EURY|nr:glutamine-hydrolyzing carbamoyl-phosphate synthase small subunit [Thermococcus chitonophagus]ASJ16288.1 carbamoyl-phosphate synthase small subunit [Thermococcus chitonophagus]CUX78725.1 Carbamoyl-phosphate synthase small chain [Thermococcus chitonophagus]